MLSPRDALVGLDNYTSHAECVFTLLLTLKGVPDINFIRQVFQKEVLQTKNKKGQLSFQRLTYYFESWMGFTFWKRDENFQIEKHVRECYPSEFDPTFQNDSITEEQLMHSLGSLATKPFPKYMSPWEILVIRNYRKLPSRLHKNYYPTVSIPTVDTDSEKDIEFAMVLRMHHALGDGFSTMKLFVQNICGDYKALMPVPLEHKLSLFQKLLQTSALIFLTGYNQFSQFILNVDRSAWHLPYDKLTKQWQFAMTEKISLNTVKSISKQQGVCVTAVLISALAGGIHNFLEIKRKGLKNKEVMRATGPMPWKNHPMDTLVNHWYYLNVWMNHNFKKSNLSIH